MKILDATVTPIAFRDPPLLNASGVHEPLALRTVVQLEVEGGVIGFGEGWGEAAIVRRLTAVRSALVGRSVFAINQIESAINEILDAEPQQISTMERRAVFSPFEVACHDAQGKLLGVPVSDLLGGAIRDRVDFSAYLFYKWPRHPAAPSDDEWGAAVDPAGIVRQAQKMIDRWGFRSIKLKAGVFHPDIEIATIQALAAAFPGYPLRIDPNGAWRPATARRVAAELSGVLEYLEDPVLGRPAMSEIAREATMPLATNMCVVTIEDVKDAVLTDAVQIVLSDHHYWGGLRHTRELGAICAATGLGVSMHSNSHLGISLAAMAHVAAATPNLDYACDTHYPWNHEDDVVTPGSLRFENGALIVPTAPGLGVEVDQQKLAKLHDTYVNSGRERRDDAGYMRTVHPDFDSALPRF